MHTSTSNRSRRTAAFGLLLLFAWGALVPALYRMDCIASDRTTISWFEPVECYAPDVEGTGEHLRTNCCIFYKTDAVDSPTVVSKQASAPSFIDEFDFRASTYRVVPPVLRASLVHRDHGPPLVQGQRLAALGVFRV
ncbi:MAG: hypothetical protein JNM62_06165 [Flavobacteriales bacterium]|nr:hypothetical protein [Flavobacteriales bacterium]